MSGFAISLPSKVRVTQSRAAPIRLGVVECDELLRDCLKALLSKDPAFSLAGVWCDAHEAMGAIADDPPDVLLLGIRLADRSGFETIRTILASFPQTRIIATVDCMEDRCQVLHPQLSSASCRAVRMVSEVFAEPDDCLQTALKMGAHGCIRLRCPYQNIAQAIHRVHAGQVAIEPPTAFRLARQFLHAIRSGGPSEGGYGALTLRERQVIALVAQGRSNKEIAAELQVSYSTVKNHVSSILDKLGLTDRTQLAVYALDHALPHNAQRAPQTAEEFGAVKRYPHPSLQTMEVTENAGGIANSAA
ncbi:MAG: LuxR C-terminal-related transcriptional regulator [Chthonomonadales bacterium]